MGDTPEETIKTYSYLSQQMAKRNLAYVQFVRYLHDFDDAKRGTPIDVYQFKQYLKESETVFILNGYYTNGEEGEKELVNNKADAISYGRVFIGNPDLVYRLKHNIELTSSDSLTFYKYPNKQPEVGYNDYKSTLQN